MAIIPTHNYLCIRSGGKMFLKITPILIILLTRIVPAQVYFDQAERFQGYKIIDDKSYFVFDESLYDVQAYRVIVEGSFRGWDHNLDDAIWWLKKDTLDARIWFLEVATPIPPGCEFKFRINNGEWMDVPEDAPNEHGGNLVYAHEYNPPRLIAEMVSPRHIYAQLSGEGIEISLNPDRFQLLDAHGKETTISRIFYIKPGELHIYPEYDIDIRRVYYLSDKKTGLKALVSYDGWFKHLYSGKQLGAFFDQEKGKTIFRLFAPRATSVNLYLYKNPGEAYFKKYALANDQNGIWELTIDRNLNGVYYDYTIHGANDPGNHFYETNPVHISDPYGQVSVDSFGPCRIWPKVETPQVVKGGRPFMEDVIAYEVHIQDFTCELPLSENKKGTFTAFHEKGLKNSIGEPIGFDHIIDLGVNVVHLQPIQESLHFPEQAWQETFANDPYMIAQGINKENYQWGYRTTHFMAIESRYREKGTEWGAQNEQFRDLVQAFHEKGVAVIVDIVFNHTGERMDGRMDYFNFAVIDKPYYYRTDEKLDYIGTYGTEVKSEWRPMVQRWIYDQCTNLVDQYGVDGFRIDLAGQTDEQTLKELRRILGPDIIIYGEPWIASADPNYENNPDWDWYKKDAPITFFQDEARNAFKGPPDNPKDKWKDRGYAGGNGGRDNVKKALSAGFSDDDTPIDGINYLDIHDNWALADRFATDNWDGRNGVDENRVKIAATLLLTSLGPVVIHGGTEFLRSKGHAPLEEIKKEFQGSYLYFHGKRDTYNLAQANAFIWENKGKISGDDSGRVKCDYKNMYEYWRGLIALRKSEIGKVFRIREKPAKDYYQWIEPENIKLLGYMVAKKILVLINTDTLSGKFNNIHIPPGADWQLVGDINQINFYSGINGKEDSILKGGAKITTILPGESLKIWVVRSKRN